MPKVNGLEVLEWLAKNPKCRVIPTIMFSNSNNVADIQTAYELGVNAYFTKPNQYQQMVDILALVNHFWTIAKRPQTILKC